MRLAGTFDMSYRDKSNFLTQEFWFISFCLWKQRFVTLLRPITETEVENYRGSESAVLLICDRSIGAVWHNVIPAGPIPNVTF